MSVSVSVSVSVEDVSSNFIFVVSQVGAEKALKAEIARDYPALRFAYSRPGFVTFKTVSAVSTVREERLRPDFALKSVFARAYGLSLEKLDVKSFPDRQARIKRVVDKASEIVVGQKNKLRLHVFERVVNNDVRNDVRVDSAIAQEIRTLGQDLFFEDAAPEIGDLVFDITLVEIDEWWLGCHRHGPLHSLFPGGNAELEMHPDAPSRAYLKLEEALIWSKAPILKDDMAVEIGSAPGGAVLALLNRGLKVIGIDPAEMAPVFNEKYRNNFRHIQRPIAEVMRSELPRSIQWLLLDMNVSPQFSLFAVDGLASRMKDSLLGVLLTVKLNEWKMAAEIPHMLEHVKVMGMARIRAKQLSYNNQEFFIYGLTQMGMRRLTVSNAKKTKLSP